jgi:hypothetical protein
MAKKKEPKKVEVLADNLEALADHIAALSEIGKMIQKSRLKKQTIMLLLKSATRVDLQDIEKILDALPELEKKFLK